MWSSSVCHKYPFLAKCSICKIYVICYVLCEYYVFCASDLELVSMLQRYRKEQDVVSVCQFHLGPSHRDNSSINSMGLA